MFKKNFLFLVLSFLSLFVVLNLTPAWSADEEALGREAEQAGKLRQALTHYVAALQSTSEGSSKDQQLREEIIKLAQKIQPPPAVPDEVIEYEGRAEAAVQYAKTPEDYLDAAKEYQKALRIVPWAASYYFNLGVVLEKSGKSEEAIRTFNFYLLAAPNAPDAREVKKKIAGLKYKQEKAAKEKQETVRQVVKSEKPWTEKLNGKWMRARLPRWHRRGGFYLSGNIYSIQVTGEQIKIIVTDVGLRGPVVHRIPVNKIAFNGSIEGNWIKGTFYHYSASSAWSRDGVLLKKTVSIPYESSVDGPINLRPNGELHIGSIGKWKRVR